MENKDFIRLLKRAKALIIKVLNIHFRIVVSDNGNTAISEFGTYDYTEFNSAEEMLEEFSVMNMPLGSLTNWMKVEYA